MGTLYVSDQVHHSIIRGAKMAGLPRANVKIIPTDNQCRMFIPELEKQIQQDRKAGLKPFLVIGAGGSVATGAVDDLAAIAEICQRENLWYHVDAAWAGGLALTKRGKKHFRGMNKADSVTIDPHKALFTPFGCGALIVRDPIVLRRAYTIDMSVNYLPTRDLDQNPWDPSDTSPELSRSVRGLGVWLPLKMLGILPFIKTMEEKLSLADYAIAALKQMPKVELAYQPQLCIIAFRFTEQGLSEDQLDKLNNQILSEINSDGRVLLTGAKIKGCFYLRIVPFGYRTHKQHVDLALDLLRKANKRIIKRRIKQKGSIKFCSFIE